MFNNPRAAESASVGIPIASIFSADELAEMERRDKEFKRKYGDWR